MKQRSEARIVDLHGLLASVRDPHTQTVLRHVADALGILARQQQTAAEPPSPLTADTKASSLTVQQISDQLAAGGVAPIVLTGLPGAPVPVSFGTHALRPAAASVAAGTFYYETDRTVLYIAATFSGAVAWAYVAGTFAATYASRPADLGTRDAGFQFVSTDTNVYEQWSGAAWVLDEISDAVTNAVTTIRRMIHITSGAAAAGFGAGLLYQLENDAGAVVNAGSIDTVWSDPAAASVDADVIFRLTAAAAAIAEKFRFSSLGNLTAVGGATFGGAAVVAGGLQLGRTGTSEPFLLLQNGAGASNLSQLRGINGGGARVTNGAASVEWWRWSSAGHYLAGTDNTFDIGAAGATRPRNVYVAGFVDVAGSYKVGGAQITSAALSDVASGVYTPGLTNTTNVAASTAYQCQYVRVGSVVTVSGKVDIDPTAAGQTVLGIALPIASNIGAEEDVGGVGSLRDVGGHSAAIYGDAANNRATLEYMATDTSNRAWSFTFTYRII